MPAGSSFYWNTKPLTAGLIAANRKAGFMVREAAAARNPAPKHIKVVGPFNGAGTKGEIQIVKGTGPLAHIMEGGRKGGYIISPGDTFTHQLTARSYTSRKTGITTSKFGKLNVGGKGNFGQALSSQNTHPGGGGLAHPISGPIFGGPMSARPYMRPAAALYPEFFRRAAPSALALSGRSAGAGLAGLLR